MTTSDQATKPRRSRLASLLGALLIGCAGAAIAAPADDIKEALKLYDQNKFDPALAKLNAVLAVQPKDAQARFLKGNILTGQNKTAEAIQVFTGITEDFPELPEPYNNLAVLYAGQGNYEKAKAALELAIHTNPTYATAHENLGDMHAQLARRAYDKALALDKTNTTAQSKLTMVRSMFPGTKAGAAAATPIPAPVQVAKAEPPKVTPLVVAPPPAATPVKAAPVAPPVAPTPPVQVAQATPAKAVPVAAAPVVEAAVKAPVAAASGTDADVRAALDTWAAAWSSQDVPGYLAAFAPNFENADGLARKAWERQRKERIEAPKSIDVKLSNVQITMKGDEATAVFRQAYKSDVLSNVSTKTMKFSKVGGRWLIRSMR